MKNLLIPVPGNHNNTVLLLALSQALEDETTLVFFPTEHAADKILREVAKELRVTLISPNDLSNSPSPSKIFFHGWSRNLAQVSSIPGFAGARKYLYGDGLSNRLMAGESEVDGFVLWASDYLDPDLVEASYPLKKFIGVYNRQIQDVWKRIVRLGNCGSTDIGLEAGASLIGMRYWGSSTYLGIGLQEVRDALSSAYENVPRPKVLWVKEDSRWQPPISQIQLVRETLAHDDVRVLDLPLRLRRNLGHLANLDAVAYTSQFPVSSFFGFDGSLPLTMHATQPKVKVILPSIRFKTAFPPAQMISENFDWHAAVLTGDVARQRDIFPQLVESQSLRRSLAGARPGPGHVDRDLGHVARVLLRDWGNDTETLTEQLSSAIQARAKQSRCRRKIYGMLRSSRYVERAYFAMARFLPLRKLLVRLARIFR